MNDINEAWQQFEGYRQYAEKSDRTSDAYMAAEYRDRAEVCMAEVWNYLTAAAVTLTRLKGDVGSFHLIREYGLGELELSGVSTEIFGVIGVAWVTRVERTSNTHQETLVSYAAFGELWTGYDRYAEHSGDSPMFGKEPNSELRMTVIHACELARDTRKNTPDIFRMF